MAMLLPFLGSKLAGLRQEPAATARKAFQGSVIVLTGGIIVGAFWGRHINREYGGKAPSYFVDSPGFAGAAPVTGPRPSDAGSSGGSSGFPGNGAGQAAIGKWLGDKMAANGLPRPLATMVTLVESNMQTGPAVRYKDADSAGPYQVRVQLHGWSLKNAEDWVYSTDNWFIKNAKQYKGQYGTSAAELGAWCQKVQGSAYPGRYAQVYNKAKQLSG